MMLSVQIHLLKWWPSTVFVCHVLVGQNKLCTAGVLRWICIFGRNLGIFFQLSLCWQSVTLLLSHCLLVCSWKKLSNEFCFPFFSRVSVCRWCVKCRVRVKCGSEARAETVVFQNKTRKTNEGRNNYNFDHKIFSLWQMIHGPVPVQGLGVGEPCFKECTKSLIWPLLFFSFFFRYLYNTFTLVFKLDDGLLSLLWHLLGFSIDSSTSQLLNVGSKLGITFRVLICLFCHWITTD